MTMPTVVRVFFAIDLSPAAKESIGRLIGDLKKRSKTHAIRWSRPENLHITLQFLAKVQSEHVDQLVNNVRAKIEGVVNKIALGIGSLQLFPSPFRPRVIVLDVSPQTELAQLSALIGQGIRDANYETENRPFRAHLTLGRIKHAHGVNLQFLPDVPQLAMDKIFVDEVVLFRSDPKPEGSVYTPIVRIELEEYVKNGTDAG
jgi:2'-5' RNA ligase